MRWCCLTMVVLLAVSAFGQESQLASDFRREGEHIKKSCGTFGFKAIGGCAQELVTDHPMHIALGSIAPQNGFGLGLAFVTHYTPNESWRLSWNADAVGATSGSWRTGVYMKLIHTPVQKITVVTTPSSKPAKSNLVIRPYTVLNVYAQAISLQKLFFFGLGPATLQTDRSVFGMRETILGTNAIVPITKVPILRGLNLSLLGEINGRFVDLRGNHGETSPSIEQLYSEATAPGLSTQPGFLQLGEGIRLKPILFSDRLQLNYLVNFQQFLAPSNSTYSFRRLTIDLNHEVPLYRNWRSATAKDTNGPDECAQAVGAQSCPSVSRNREGAIGMRLLISESITSGSSVVPFYFQPTLGGSDLNGNPSLSSYQDYRFRGPNVLFLRESFEHSIWGPFGFTFMADQGKVALRRDDVDFQDLKHSFATGVTLRAGGFPQVFLMFAWGGNEGHHTIFNLNTSLLGGSSRPALY